MKEIIKTKEQYDMIIIGSGPAGLSAAIYAARAKLHALVLEENYVSGGQVLNTYEVDNYPGLPGMNGFDMGTVFQEHAKKLGAVILREKVEAIQDAKEEIKTVVTNKAQYQAKTLIIATGARHSKLAIVGEEELAGRGVSYCATCDGAFFKNKTTAVIGGGDVAVEDAIFLSRICKKVYVVHRREELRAAKVLQERLLSLENVEMVWNHVAKKILGEEQVETLELEGTRNKEKKELKVDGVFVAVGILPNSQLYQGILEMDEKGYIIAKEDGQTSLPGIFAAGDVRTKMLRQIVTATADGANSVTSAQNYLIHRSLRQ